MSFEKTYNASNGANEVTKISNFIASLSIKNDYEAYFYETTESESNYHNNYYRPYMKVDTFSDYSLSELKKANEVAKMSVPEYAIGDETLLDGFENYVQFNLNLLCEGGSNIKNVGKFLDFCRHYRILNYTELNGYYAQYDGKPKEPSQTIMIKNFDTDKDPSLEIPIHMLNDVVYPNTYRNVFIINNKEDEGFGYGIDYYKEKYPDYIYLRFIDSKPLYITKTQNATFINRIDYYLLRTCDNFTLLTWDVNILDSTEFYYFVKAYETAKLMVEHEYFSSFEDRFPFYPTLMIVNLLKYTLSHYTNMYIERYSVKDYRLEDIHNILDSLNLSELKKINDTDKLYRLVKILDELIINKGSENNLIRIVKDVMGEDIQSLRKCTLIRKYNVDGYGNIRLFDENGNYIESDLVIKESSIVKGDTLNDMYYDYDDYVVKDDLWGGKAYNNGGVVNSDAKKSVRDKIIRNNINNVDLKYIIFRKSISLLKVVAKQNELFGFLIKFIERVDGRGNSGGRLHNNVIELDNGVYVSPSTLFATLTYFHNIITLKDHTESISDTPIDSQELKDPSSIPSSQYSSINKFYSSLFSSIDDTIPNLRNDEIKSHFDRYFYYDEHGVLRLSDENDKIDNVTNKNNIISFKEVLLYYCMVWDMYPRVLSNNVIYTLNSNSWKEYPMSYLQNVILKKDTSNDAVFDENNASSLDDLDMLLDNNLTIDRLIAHRTYENDYIINKLIQIIGHLWTNYNLVGSDIDKTSNGYMDRCISRYKDGSIPSSASNYSIDLFNFNVDELQLPVVRDTNDRPDVIGEIYERLSRSDLQSQHIIWNEIDRLNKENPNTVEAFLTIDNGNGLKYYDNLLEFILENNTDFMYTLLGKGLVKVNAHGQYVGLRLSDYHNQPDAKKTIVEEIYKYYNELKDYMVKWTLEQSVYAILGTMVDQNTSDYVSDLKILIKEFVSIFKDLSSVVFDTESDIKYMNMMKPYVDRGNTVYKYSGFPETNGMVNETGLIGTENSQLKTYSVISFNSDQTNHPIGITGDENGGWKFPWNSSNSDIVYNIETRIFDKDEIDRLKTDEIIEVNSYREHQIDTNKNLYSNDDTILNIDISEQNNT